MNTHDNTTGTEQITNSERQRTASGMPVIRIPQKVYETIAEEIIDKVDGRPYYEMQIERDNGTYAWEYSIKFYAYYEVDRRPDGDATCLKEIAPIWAEFHMWFSDDEEELQNDFDAEKLRDHGIPYNKPFTTSGVRPGTQSVSRP